MAERWREGNRWDAVINGVNYRFKRAEGVYRKVSSRSMLQIQQMLNQSGNQYSSRDDLRTLFQTDWSGGAQWQKPLLSEQSIDSYYTSTGFDLVTEPGNIIPTPDHAFLNCSVAGANIQSSKISLFVSNDEIYYAQATTDAGNIGLIKWNGSTLTALTNDFGYDTGSVVAMCHDAVTDTVYALFSTGVIRYLTIDTAGGAVTTVTTTYSDGSNIFMHLGRLMVYNGDQLYEIEDPLGTPSLTTIYNDGMGRDVLNEMNHATGTTIYDNTTRLAIPSSEGVWIVKNVNNGGSVMPQIVRIDRTNDGTNVGIPIASLPAGTMVLDVAYHLGSLIMATATDTQKVYANVSATAGFPRIVFYHLTNDSLGTVGSILGGFTPAEAPYRFLGSRNEFLYIGGLNSVWVYDAIRGGFHRWFEEDAYAVNTGVYISLVDTVDAAGSNIQQIGHTGGSTLVQLPVADVGGSSASHTLESNYLDGNLPAEQKSLVGITLMTSGIKTGETWTVSIEADDAATFTSAAVFNTVGAKTSYKDLVTAITGYRFRYKLAWTATGDITTPSRVKGIVLHMVQGQMVTAWQLTIDGSEVQGIENDTVRPEVALGTLETLAGTQALVSYVDKFRTTSSTHDVRVDSVQIARSAPQEIDEAVVVLTEQNLNN